MSKAIKKVRLHTFLCTVLLCTSVYASPRDRGFGFYMDQDLLVPISNEDRDYTMGMAFEFFWSKEKSLPLDFLVTKAGKWLGIDEKENNFTYSLMLGTVAYTPDDLADSQPIFSDRPYSSLIYLSNKRVHADGKTALAAEVMVGLIGTDIARYVQTQFHEWYRSLNNSDEPVEPMGWDHQISNGGEPTFRIRLTNAHLHTDLSKAGVYDVSSSYGLSLGYQTNASVSIAGRLGNVQSPFWSIPFDPVNRGNFIPSRAKDEWYFWSAFRIHLVAYDALLQGQFRDSDVEYAADQIEPLVYDGGVGFTWTFDKSQITLSANAKSPDLKFVSRHQVWGGINYMIYF